MTRFCQSLGLLGVMFVVALGAINQATAADSLDDLRREARTADSPQEKSSSSSSGSSGRSLDVSGFFSADDDCCDDDCDSDDDAVLTQLALLGLSSPFWAPQALMRDNYDITYRFPEYPHQYRRGYMISDAQTRGGRGEELCRLDLGVRASGEYGTNFSGIDWMAGRFLLETSARFGLDADFRFLEEHLGAGATDSLWLGDMNFFYRFAQSRRCTVRAGVGFNWLSDTQQDDFGANFTYAVDWYPHKPMVVSAEMDFGWLGDASLFHGRLTTGVNYRNAEAYIGYDYLRIDDFDLNGLVAGVRLWW